MPLRTITWLADKLMQHRLDDKKALRDKWDRVAAYFDELADCLEKMTEKFKRHEIPRAEGNQFKILIQHFDEIVHSIYSKENEPEKTQVHEMLCELFQTADQATNQDIQMMATGYYDKSDIGYPKSEEWIATFAYHRQISRLGSSVAWYNIIPSSLTADDAADRP